MNDTGLGEPLVIFLLYIFQGAQVEIEAVAIIGNIVDSDQLVSWLTKEELIVKKSKL